ncbi:MAG: phosphotransferase, partial [Pseudomonadota bacterium]
EKSKEKYVVRLPNKPCKELFDRYDETKNVGILKDLNKKNSIVKKTKLGPEIIYIDNKGIQISVFIPNTSITNSKLTKTLDNNQSLKNAIRAMVTLNLGNFKLTNTVDIFQRNELIHNFLKTEGVFGKPMDDDFKLKFNACWEMHGDVKKYFGANPQPKFPCHNDITAGNLIKSDVTDEIVILDFEYAGMNSVLWELANFIVQTGIELDGDAFVNYLDTVFAEYVKQFNQTQQKPSSEKFKPPSPFADIDKAKQQLYLYCFAVEVWRTVWGLYQRQIDNMPLGKKFYDDQIEICLGNAEKIKYLPARQTAFKALLDLDERDKAPILT